jgi:lipopolysaccharide/colanic/teichoic acid biosynthesis glycosyltransferase
MSTRITTNFRPFRLIKFRTMRAGPGSSVTVRDDPRVTRVGRWLRHYRLDELPQLINVVRGDMTLVGIRPEAPVFVDAYTPEMRATLLLPAGLTSPASIDFLDEHQLLSGGDPHAKYVTVILPQKMSLNLEYLRTYGILRDIHIVFETAFRMVFRDR